MVDTRHEGAEIAKTEKPIPAWRYYTGLGLFIFGNILIFSSPIIVPALGLGGTYIAIGVVLAEAIMLSSVFFLGWSRLLQLKKKLFSFFKRPAKAQPVGKFRHYLGVFLVTGVSIGLDALGILLVFVAFAKATSSDPFPIVLGLSHDQVGWAVAILFIGSYLSLIAGLLLLGESWWKRFRDVFVWQEDLNTRNI